MLAAFDTIWVMRYKQYNVLHFQKPIILPHISWAGAAKVRLLRVSCCCGSDKGNPSRGVTTFILIPTVIAPNWGKNSPDYLEAPKASDCITRITMPNHYLDNAQPWALQGQKIPSYSPFNLDFLLYLMRKTLLLQFRLVESFIPMIHKLTISIMRRRTRQQLKRFDRRRKIATFSFNASRSYSLVPCLIGKEFIEKLPMCHNVYIRRNHDPFAKYLIIEVSPYPKGVGG